MIIRLFFSFMEFVLRPYLQHTHIRWACHYLSGRGTKMYLPKEFLVEQLLYDPCHSTTWAVPYGLFMGDKKLINKELQHVWETTVGKFLYKDTATMRHLVDYYVFYENCEGVQLYSTESLDGVCSHNHCHCADTEEPNWPTSTIKSIRKKINTPRFFRKIMFLRTLDKQITINFGIIHIRIRIWFYTWSGSQLHLAICPSWQDEWMSRHGKPFWSVGHIAHTERINT